MKNIIIFCQAPADIQYALSIYDKHKENAEISIFCVNVEGMYKFFSGLNLRLQKLVFIPYKQNFSLKNPIHILYEKIRLKKFYKIYFEDLEGNDIYFFSHFHDWITFSLVSKLSRYNTVKFIEHYDDCYANYLPLQVKINLKERIYLFVLKFISNTKIRWLKTNIIRIPEFLYEEYDIEKKEAPNIGEMLYERYSFKFKNLKNEPILLFESDHTNTNSIINYENKIMSIVNTLREKGFTIYLKPHPRLGYSKHLKKYISGILPIYVPGEMINIKSFIGILGVETGVIANFANRMPGSIYSLINLFDFRDEQEKEMFKNFLVEQSNGNIKFIDSLDCLFNLLEYGKFCQHNHEL